MLAIEKRILFFIFFIFKLRKGKFQSLGFPGWEFWELGFFILFYFIFFRHSRGFLKRFFRGGKWDFNGEKSGAEGILGFNSIFISGFISVFIPALGRREFLGKAEKKKGRSQKKREKKSIFSLRSTTKMGLKNEIFTLKKSNLKTEKSGFWSRNSNFSSKENKTRRGRDRNFWAKREILGEI